MHLNLIRLDSPSVPTCLVALADAGRSVGPVDAGIFLVLGGKDGGGGGGKGEGSNRKELDHDDGMIWKVEFSGWQRCGVRGNKYLLRS